MRGIRGLNVTHSPLPSRCRRAVQAAALTKNASIQQNLPWHNASSFAEDDEETDKKKKEKGSVVAKRQPKADVNEENAEPRTRGARRMRRATGAASVTASSAAQQRLANDKIAFYDDDRTEPNYGGFGKGEMHWYALWVLTMKEEDLGQDLEASISRLGSVKDGKGNLVAREVESWVPSKMKLKWSNRFKRMTETPVKYGDGNWVFLQCIMDKEVYDLLADTPAFRGFRPESCIEIRDKFEAMHTFPNPLTDDFLASVKDWESTVDEPDEASLALAEMHANSEPEVEVERADEPELDTFRTGQDDYLYNGWGAPGETDGANKKSRRSKRTNANPTWDDDSNSTFSNNSAQNDEWGANEWAEPQDFSGQDRIGDESAQNFASSAVQDAERSAISDTEEPEVEAKSSKPEDPTNIELEWGVDTPANRKAIARTLKSMENLSKDDDLEEGSSDEEEEETSSFSLFTDSFAKGKYANRSFDPKFTLGGDDRDRNRNRRNDRFGQNSGRGFRGRGGRRGRNFQDNDFYEGSYQQEGFGRGGRRRRNFSNDYGDDYDTASFQEEGFGRGRGRGRGQRFSDDDDYYAGSFRERQFGGRTGRGRGRASNRFNDRGRQGRGQWDNDYDDSFDNRRRDFGPRERDMFQEEGRASDDDDFSGWNDFGGSDFKASSGGRKQRRGQWGDNDSWEQGGAAGGRKAGNDWDDDFWGRDDDQTNRRNPSAQRDTRSQADTGAGSLWDDGIDFDDDLRDRQDQWSRTERSSGRFQTSGRGRNSRRQPPQDDSRFQAFDNFSADEASMFDDIWNDPVEQPAAQPRSANQSGRGSSRSRSRSPGGVASEAKGLWDDDDMFGGGSDFGGAGGGVSKEWDQWEQQQSTVADGRASKSGGSGAGDAPGNALWGDDWGDFSADKPAGSQRSKRSEPAGGGDNLWDDFDDFGSFDEKFDSNRQKSTRKSFDKGFSEYDVDFEDLAHLDAYDTDVWGSPSPDARSKPQGRASGKKSQPRDMFQDSDEDWIGGGFDASPAGASGDDIFDSGVSFTGWGDNGSAGKPLTHKPGQGPHSRQSQAGSQRAAMQSSDHWSGDDDLGGNIWGSDDWQSGHSADEGNTTGNIWGSKASEGPEEPSGSRATVKVTRTKKLVIKEVPDPEYIDPVDPTTNQPVNSEEEEESGSGRRMRRMKRAT